MSGSEKLKKLRRRLSLAGGDLPTRLKIRGARIAPYFLEPLFIAAWVLLLFPLATPQRRAVMGNFAHMFPGESWPKRFWRAFRLFWNFAVTEADAAHSLTGTAGFNWEVEGAGHFAKLSTEPVCALILTAHMSNYDVAAHLFAERMQRPLHTVRAPERIPEMQELMEGHRRRLGGDQSPLRVHYNTRGSMLALDLIQALGRNEIVAIQGDRAEGVEARVEGQLYGRPTALPKGPFALAAATGCDIYPVFIVRSGWRRYKIVCLDPIRYAEVDQGRNADTIPVMVDRWCQVLELVTRQYWHQWYNFFDYWNTTPSPETTTRHE